MERNLYQDINNDMDWKRYVNDSDYPWDESFTMSASEMDGIKRSLVFDRTFIPEKLVSLYQY